MLIHGAARAKTRCRIPSYYFLERPIGAENVSIQSQNRFVECPNARPGRKPENASSPAR